jgi:hypothetical protein
MASTSVPQDTASRKYTDKQKSMLVHCLIKNKPIGGEGDGKMEKKMETCYTAVADSFNQLNAELLQTGHLTTSKRSPPRFVRPKFCKAFFGECLKRHNKLALEKGVNRHIQAGETGQAADGQPANVNQAIEEADKVWSEFWAFHAAFGTLQRLRNDVFCETLRELATKWGMPHCSISVLCIHPVLNALHKVLVIDRVTKTVRFPRETNDLKAVLEGFRRKFRLPGVAGAIDGTMIMIKAGLYRYRYYIVFHIPHAPYGAKCPVWGITAFSACFLLKSPSSH